MLREEPTEITGAQNITMKSKLLAVVGLILASVFGPIVIGASSGLGLSGAADGNETFSFAESYYTDILHDLSENSDSYRRERSQFAQIGRNHWGIEVHGNSECQLQLDSSVAEEEQLVGAALSYQRSLVLQQIFDQSGIDAIEALPSPLVGGLMGCRYTVLALACKAWTRKKILRQSGARGTATSKEKQEWMRRDEAASCKAAAAFGGSTRKR